MKFKSSMEEDIAVTVWCSAYNHEKYIRSALEGFVMQKTNFKFEVIVHDDASMDNTAEIIREYEEKYPAIFKPIYQTINQYQLGVNKVENFLLPNARGKYIAYCEGDDFWSDENKLQQQYDVMKKNPEVVLCVHKVRYLNEDGSETEQYAPGAKAKLYGNKLLLQKVMAELMYKRCLYPFHTSSYFIKKDLLSSETYISICSIKGKMNGDMRILHSAMLEGKTYYINNIMSCRRLLTIGNYNNRYNSLPIEKKRESYKKEIEAIIHFDEMTNQQFHEVISPGVYSRIIGGTYIYGEKDLRQLFFEYREKNKFPLLYSPKLTLRYFLFLCPVPIRKIVSNLFCKIRKL